MLLGSNLERKHLVPGTFAELEESYTVSFDSDTNIRQKKTDIVRCREVWGRFCAFEMSCRLLFGAYLMW